MSASGLVLPLRKPGSETIGPLPTVRNKARKSASDGPRAWTGHNEAHKAVQDPRRRKTSGRAVGRIASRRRLIAALALILCATGSHAAPPGPFQIDGQGTIFDNPGQTSPEGSQLEYPLACLTPPGSTRQSILTGAGPSVYRTITLDPTEQAFYVEGGPAVPYPVVGAQPFDFTQGNLLMVGPVDASGAPKIYGEMFIDSSSPHAVGLFDAATGTLEQVSLTYGLPVAQIDVDGDGVPEAIVLDDPNYVISWITVMDAKLTHVLFSAPITFALQTAFTVGRFDSSGRAEIVTSAGLVYQLAPSGMTQVGSIPATLNGNPIRLLAAGDVNGDGVDEIIAVYEPATVVAYRLNTQTPLWQVTPTLNSTDLIVTLSVLDLAGNGHLQVLAGQQADDPAIQSGGIYVFDGATGAQQLAFAHPDQGLSSLTACDVEGTGVLDLVSEQWIYDGASRLYVNDSRTGAQKYRSHHEAGPVEGVVVADVEGTGSPEVVFMPNGIVGDGDLALHARDAATFARLWDTPSPFLPVLGTGALDTLAAGNAAGDGHTDLVVGSTQNGNGIIWIVDGPTHTLMRTIQLDPGDNVAGVVLADLDGTGAPKIVAGVWGYMPAIPRLEVIDGSTGTRLWHVPIGSEPLAVLRLKVADLNGDGHDDVIVHMNIDYSGGPEIYVLDGATHAIRPLAVTNVSAFESIVTGAGAPLGLAVAHDDDGSIELFDSASGSSLGKHVACHGQMNALSRDNLSSAGPEEVLFNCGNQLGWMALETGATELFTANVGNYLGFSDNLFSFGTGPSTDRILVNSNIGIVHLSPTPSLPPYLYPIAPGGDGYYATHWRTLGGGAITSGTFDGSATPTLKLLSQPTYGTVTLGANNTFSYQANGPHKGVDSFVIQASTAQGTSPPTSILMILTNAAPIMVPGEIPNAGTLSVTPGGSGTAVIPATDADGDPLTFQLQQNPTQGTVTFQGYGAVYTANPGASGTDTFSVVAFDQLEYSTPFVVTVTIAAASPPPPPPPSPPPSPPPAPPSGGGGGGGGSIDPVTLVLLLAWGLAHHLRQRRSHRPVPGTDRLRS